MGDLSFSGAAAVACAEAGLRAVVYLEVFGEGPEALGRFHELRERVEGSLSARVRLGVAPHAPTRSLYRQLWMNRRQRLSERLSSSMDRPRSSSGSPTRSSNFLVTGESLA